MDANALLKSSGERVDRMKNWSRSKVAAAAATVSMANLSSDDKFIYLLLLLVFEFESRKKRKRKRIDCDFAANEHSQLLQKLSFPSFSPEQLVNYISEP